MGKLEKTLIGVIVLCVIGLAAYLFKNTASRQVASVEVAATAPDSGNKVPKSKARIALETELEPVVSKFLASNRFGDPAREIPLALPFNEKDPSYKILNGRYLGVVRTEKTNQEVRLFTAIRTMKSNLGLVGLMAGQIGNKESKRDFKMFAAIRKARGGVGQRDSALVQVGPSSFMQLFYIADRDQWVGNFYDQAASGKLEYVGVARLARN